MNCIVFVLTSQRYLYIKTLTVLKFISARLSRVCVVLHHQTRFKHLFQIFNTERLVFFLFSQLFDLLFFFSLIQHLIKDIYLKSTSFQDGIEFRVWPIAS